jgi:DNA repair and recombination protein RAD54B
LLRHSSPANVQLLRKKEDGSHDEDAIDFLQSALAVIPPKTRTVDATISGEENAQDLADATGKLTVLENILSSVAYARNEKIVVVSSWTTTLNLIQDLCIRHRYDFLRLDGSTPQKQRQELVDRFNRGSVQDSMVFLLSAKAGGVGLNLIG